MKVAIHPKIYADTKVSCACGNTFETISTLPTIHVDICSNCHPLFTGQQKFVDVEGRIDKFQKKAKQIEVEKEKLDIIKKAKKTKALPQKEVRRGSLKDILKQLKDEDKAANTSVDETSTNQ